MRRWYLPLLGIGSLLLAGCPDEHPPEIASPAFCTKGVSFDLAPLWSYLPEQGDLTIQVCLDKKCDTVTLSEGTEDFLCVRAPNGQPDQFTWCESTRSGYPKISTMGIDSQSENDQNSHSAAIAIKDDKGALLYSYATLFTFQNSSCGIKRIPLSWREPTH